MLRSRLATAFAPTNSLLSFTNGLANWQNDKLPKWNSTGIETQLFVGCRRDLRPRIRKRTRVFRNDFKSQRRRIGHREAVYAMGRNALWRSRPQKLGQVPQALPVHATEAGDAKTVFFLRNF